MSNKSKNSVISIHETLNGALFVNWEKAYQKEYSCPQCNKGHLVNVFYDNKALCRVRLSCNSCTKYTFLTCHLPIRFYSYLPDITCPNPNCTELGPKGQKGWIYQICHPTSPCKCHFCGVTFSTCSTRNNSWVSNQQKKELQPFDFEENIWNLSHFYDNALKYKYLKFEGIEPDWYYQIVKRYCYEVLKNKVYSSTSTVKSLRIVLNQFGQIIKQRNISLSADISRETVLAFINSCIPIQASTLCGKLSLLKPFLNWLSLDANSLLKQWDFPKISYNDPIWLDESIRASIHKHLPKIPAPIACHYLVQEFTAARPGDVCQLPFDCLIEENDKWYIQFFQQKVNRWHRIPATRDIRRVIEEQQQWIRQTFGEEYAYLFCHFRSFKEVSYPKFPRIKPLPYPPAIESKLNPMVRIIRCLIIKEDIRDVNGQLPHFTGKITRASRLQEIRVKNGIEAAQLYADHIRSKTTLQHYAPPTREQIAQADMPFQELLLNRENKFLPWQSLPESLLQNPKAHELDLEIAPRLVVYGHCSLDPKTPCPFNLYPKCYGCGSFRPSTEKLPLYERQYEAEKQRMFEAKVVGASLAYEEAKATLTAMEQWLPQLQEVANNDT